MQLSAKLKGITIIIHEPEGKTPTIIDVPSAETASCWVTDNISDDTTLNVNFR